MGKREGETHQSVRSLPGVQERASTMGLDDMLFDRELKDQVLELLSGIVSYNLPEPLTEEALTECEAHPLYHGYSLAFHMVAPIVRVCHLGLAPPGALSKEGEERVRLVARSFVLRKLVLELGSQVSAQNEGMGPTSSLVDPPSLALALLVQAESRVQPHIHGTADN